MMGAKVLGLILWLSCPLSVLCADVSRYFSGSGYLEYDMLNDASKRINSNVDELSLQFKTVQPAGLLFHGKSSGGDSGDYITVELVGGRLRFSIRLGKFQNVDDAKEVFLGKDLGNGKPHSVVINHENKQTMIVLDAGSSDEEKRVVSTTYEKLELDTSIFVGGALSFKSFQGVQSNENFMGCLINVKFTPENKQAINFLESGVASSVSVDMTKGCPLETFDPFTFSDKDSSFTFTVKKQNVMKGGFKFRTYAKDGTVLQGGSSSKGFTITFDTQTITLTVNINNNPTTAYVSFSSDHPVNSGNWHNVNFEISTGTISLEVGTKSDKKPPGSSLPADFFQDKVTAGGYIGCMWDLKVNDDTHKPDKDSTMKNVEWQGCNITDFCIWKPCLHGGRCSQDGKMFECDCTGTTYTKPVCQFSEYFQTCNILKRNVKDRTSGNETLDVDGPGPLPSFKAYCNMTAEPYTTEIFSLSQGVKIVVHPPSAGAGPKSIHRDIRYFPSFAAANALGSNSGSCRQYIDYGCKKAPLSDFVSWVSRDGLFQSGWGGASPQSKMCACGEQNKCLGGKKCNCDALEDKWVSDPGWLISDKTLPVSQVVSGGVNSDQGSEANFTVGNLICSGEVSNTATFVNEDGMIRLPKPWTPPSHGVISFFFKTPYHRGMLLFNGDLDKDYVQLFILNETCIRLMYDIGHGPRRVDVCLKGNKKVNDREWHKVVVYRNLLNFGLKLDAESAENVLPLFLAKDLDLDESEPLIVGGFPNDVSKGFVGCIRGLAIDGNVINLAKEAETEDYVESGCGAACGTHECKNSGKCVDDYNVYQCDCSMTPFYGYFCQKDEGASFKEKDSQLIYTYPTAESVPGLMMTVGFKFESKDNCFGDIIKINSKTTDQVFRLSIDNNNKNLVFYFKAFGGDGSYVIDHPTGGSFCDEERHTFAMSRLNKQLNYTVDGGKVVSKDNEKLNIGFSTMNQVIVGSTGDRGFKGCLTGVKVTKRSFDKEHATVEPIKAFVYDGVTEGFTATGVTQDSKMKCGEEPPVPPIPTPRPVGGGQGGGDTTVPPGGPTSGKRSDEDNNMAIIVVVVLILVLLLVVLVIAIYWYWARHKGEYHTHEDDDMLTGGDPYIDMGAQKNLAAEEPEKKKEWYI